MCAEFDVTIGRWRVFLGWHHGAKPAGLPLFYLSRDGKTLRLVSPKEVPDLLRCITEAERVAAALRSASP